MAGFFAYKIVSDSMELMLGNKISIFCFDLLIMNAERQRKTHRVKQTETVLICRYNSQLLGGSNSMQVSHMGARDPAA